MSNQPHHAFNTHNLKSEQTTDDLEQRSPTSDKPGDGHEQLVQTRRLSDYCGDVIK